MPDTVPTVERIGKYLQVQRLPARPRKTCRWAVLTNARDTLGLISWYGPWRCYVFEAREGCVFNATCLRDIAAFCARVRDVREGA